MVALAAAAANLPFFSERILGLFPLPAGKGAAPGAGERTKRFPLRLLESRIGSVYVQTWEFYAVTGCLFLVLAFPGFVLRYLRKRRA